MSVLRRRICKSIKQQCRPVPSSDGDACGVPFVSEEPVTALCRLQRCAGYSVVPVTALCRLKRCAGYSVCRLQRCAVYSVVPVTALCRLSVVPVTALCRLHVTCATMSLTWLQS